VVASGEPGTPVVCWAPAGMHARTKSVAVENASVILRIRYLPLPYATRTERADPSDRT